ncbi:hypothetical protein AB1A65_12445 [Muricauda sp. ANG21]|uniref:hypothetical protein n=1 Tax=Allomuricauda sp. ANG21 TaxID=3042468 RepID=UPI003453346A
MKRALSIFALALLTVGMFSCEPETDVQDTEAMIKTLKLDQDQATDGKHSDGDEGRGNG